MEPDFLEQGEQVVPELHHVRDEPTHGLFKVAVLTVTILEHQADACDTVGLEPAQVVLNAREIAPPEQAGKLGPGYCVIVADRRPDFATIRREVW
jgi:hypothetical protein